LFHHGGRNFLTYVNLQLKIAVILM